MTDYTSKAVLLQLKGSACISMRIKVASVLLNGEVKTDHDFVVG